MFNITKTGKVAGCYITEGVVKRGAGVRVLRDNVVIHNGELSQLKRFKDDVQEVARGYECGLSFANFQICRKATWSSASRRRWSRVEEARPRRGRPSGSCAWRRKSATCCRVSLPGTNSAIRNWPPPISP